jgi:hypothetical protein
MRKPNGAISEFVRHVLGLRVQKRDVVAVVEIYRNCAAGVG